MRKITLSVLLVLGISLIYANFDLPTNINKLGYFNPKFQLGSIFDPNTVKMTQSMSFGSGMSSNGLGFYQSTYTNHLNFDLRENLKFKVDLSLVNFGTMTHSNKLDFKSNNDNQNVVIPSFSLDYKPTDTTNIRIEFHQYTTSPFNYNYNHDHDFPW